MSPIQSRDALEAGFVPSDLPPRAPDGGLELTPAPVKLPVIQPMSLCELGPCRRYHRLVQKIDAQAPLDGSEAPIATSVVRTCYPSPGIEYDLTGEPVKECSLWSPMTDDERSQLEETRENFTWGDHRSGGQGKGREYEAYKAFLASWTPPPDE
jgi:hypothetical protein